MSDVKYEIIEGKVKWAKVHEPTDTFDGNGKEYSIDVEVSDETYKRLVGLGLNPKRARKIGEDGLGYLTFKKPTVSKAGKPLVKPHVFNKNQEPLEDLIGNGSTAKVKLSLIPYSNKFGTGVSIRLEAIMVTDLVTYTKPVRPDAAGFFDTDALAAIF